MFDVPGLLEPYDVAIDPDTGEAWVVLAGAAPLSEWIPDSSDGYVPQQVFNCRSVLLGVHHSQLTPGLLGHIIAGQLEQHAFALLARPPALHVVVTGRNARPALIEAADLVTEMTAVKHHFAAGVKAQQGIEF